MTADEFRRIALHLPDVEERAHVGHPDFRVGGKIFATLGYPDAAHGMVKLTPEQQEKYMRIEPEVFRPSAGAWGRSGSTLVNLASAKARFVNDALHAAHANIAAKPAARRGKSANKDSA